MTLELIVCVLFTRETDGFVNSTVPDDKLEPEGLDKATPLKVFRTPNRVARTKRASCVSIAKLDQDGDDEIGKLDSFYLTRMLRYTNYISFFHFNFLQIKMNQVQILMLVLSIDPVAVLEFAIRAHLPDD
jgi:hypothetical protein